MCRSLAIRETNGMSRFSEGRRKYASGLLSARDFVERKPPRLSVENLGGYYSSDMGEYVIRSHYYFVDVAAHQFVE